MLYCIYGSINNKIFYSVQQMCFANGIFFNHHEYCDYLWKEYNLINIQKLAEIVDFINRLVSNVMRGSAKE
jgi:hypothetical protein